jgi:hypothetical protein
VKASKVSLTEIWLPSKQKQKKKKYKQSASKDKQGMDEIYFLHKALSGEPVQTFLIY